MRRITEQHGEEAGFFFTNKYIFLSWCLHLGNYSFKILNWFGGNEGTIANVLIFLGIIIIVVFVVVVLRQKQLLRNWHSFSISQHSIW